MGGFTCDNDAGAVLVGKRRHSDMVVAGLVNSLPLLECLDMCFDWPALLCLPTRMGGGGSPTPPPNQS